MANADGWSNETRYNTGVLVGNWVEERKNVRPALFSRFFLCLINFVDII